MQYGSVDRKETRTAVAYLRTSSAANVGADKDSDQRQLEAIRRFAEHAGYGLVEPAYYDMAVSGADHLEDRPGFAAMLERITSDGINVILVETANRFARDLMVQEVGHAMLRDLGISLIAVDSPHSFVDDTPTATLIRQVLGAVAEFDKAMTVAKLKGARDRKSKAAGRRVEGRKGFHQTHLDAVLLAKRLRRVNPATGRRRSLRKIAQELAGAGYRNENGEPFNPRSVKAMVEGPRPKSRVGPSV